MGNTYSGEPHHLYTYRNAARETWAASLPYENIHKKGQATSGRCLRCLTPEDYTIYSRR